MRWSDSGTISYSTAAFKGHKKNAPLSAKTYTGTGYYLCINPLNSKYTSITLFTSSDYLSPLPELTHHIQVIQREASHKYLSAKPDSSGQTLPQLMKSNSGRQKHILYLTINQYSSSQEVSSVKILVLQEQLKLGSDPLCKTEIRYKSWSHWKRQKACNTAGGVTALTLIKQVRIKPTLLTQHTYHEPAC